MKRFLLLLCAVALCGCPGNDSQSGNVPAPGGSTPPLGMRPWVSFSNLVLSPDGKYLLASYSWRPEGLPVPPWGLKGFRLHRLWEVPEGREVRAFSEPLAGGDVFLPDSDLCISSGLGAHFTVPDEQSGELVRVERPEGPIYVWEVKTGKVVRSFDKSSKGLRVLAVSPDGNALAGEDQESKELQLWDVPGGQLLHKLGVKVTHVEFSPDGKTLHASLLTETEMRNPLRDIRTLHAASFDVASGKQTVHFHIKDGHDGILAFSPDGKLVVIERDRGPREKSDLVLWDAAVGTELRKFEPREGGDRPPYGSAYASAFSPDGKEFVTVDGDGMMRRWDVASGKHAWAVEVTKIGFKTAALTPDGRVACVAAGEGKSDSQKQIELRVWDAVNGKLLRTLVDPK